ncbi:MAG: hypothetical protein A2Y14_00850 [Verrucomicrobia bacterium GWF2_51_19]|nr:MAG: hypothetical protein A2Y14_00850 [Verrucomicrobia bacterium GWF2_51_19]
MTFVMNEQHTILLVDDEPTNLSVLCDFLKQFNFRLLSARNGEKALEIAKTTIPDIILLDLIMPGLDGFQVCEQLKKMPETKDIPVIFLSVIQDVQDKVDAFEVGAVDYITKPLQQEEVLARLNTHLTISRLQKELQVKIDEQNTLIQELDAFAHTVAHELKSSLNGIINMAEILSSINNELEAKAISDYADTMYVAGLKANKIVNELLFLSSVRKKKFKPEAFDMRPVVDAALKRLENHPRFKEAQITIAKDLPKILGYAPWIEEVWFNYLSNALKYAKEGLPAILEVGFTQDNDNATFFVRDEGIGISPEDIPGIFVPFNRINQINSEGHGLGLSIVHRILEKLDGAVNVESEWGVGSTFSFKLKTVKTPALAV